MFEFRFNFKHSLNDESVAPVVEIIYGAFTEGIIGMASWGLLPQL